MTTEEIQQLAKLLAAESSPGWWTYLFALIAAAVGAAGGAYLKKWGELTAVNEAFTTLRDQQKHIAADAAAIKSKFDTIIESQKLQNQLRTAALERRLDAHQKAFVLWRKLMTKIYTDECASVVLECQTFWEENCVFLGPKTDTAFFQAYMAATVHRDMLRERVPAKEITANWQVIAAAAAIIRSEVALPPLVVSVEQLTHTNEEGPIPEPSGSGSSPA